MEQQQASSTAEPQDLLYYSAQQLFPGLDEEHIVLESSDKHCFLIKKEIAMGSKTLQSLLSAPKEILSDKDNHFARNHIQVHFSSEIVSKICKYLTYKNFFTKNSSMNIPEFEVDPSDALDILGAANFFDC